MGKRKLTKYSVHYKQFERIYTLYAGRIYNFVLKITHGNSYLAEEITQIVFVKFWERIEMFNEEQDMMKLKGYLFSIARNTLVNYLKHETLEHIYLTHLKETTPEEYSADDMILSSFLNDYVQTLIRELPPMRQKVFRLSRLQYLSIPEVASELGIAESTVETHLSLALKFMREELKRRYKL